MGWLDANSFRDRQRFRSDVGAVLADNGLHGFSIPIPAGYASGIAHTIQIRYEASGTPLPGSPATLNGGISGGTNYAGYVDSASYSGIDGRAADKNRLNASIVVSLWDSSTQIASATATGSRGDLGVEAVYERGVLRPLEPLALAEHQRVRLTLDEKPLSWLSTEPVNERREEMQWLAKESGPYAGQRVALDGSRLIAHGAQLAAVSADARATGVEEPLFAYLAGDRELPFAGW